MNSLTDDQKLDIAIRMEEEGVLPATQLLTAHLNYVLPLEDRIKLVRKIYDEIKK